MPFFSVYIQRILPHGTGANAAGVPRSSRVADACWAERKGFSIATATPWDGTSRHAALAGEILRRSLLTWSLAETLPWIA